MKTKLISLCLLLWSVSVSDEIYAATPEDLLETLIGELSSENLPQPFQSSLINRLESAARVLVDSKQSNEAAAIGILGSFINYASAIGLDEELIAIAQSVIDAIEQTNDIELPDLTVLAEPSDQCDQFPNAGATLFLVGDISFSVGVASGFETFFVFGNETFTNNFGELECLVSYSLTGVHNNMDNTFELDVTRESSTCPVDLTNLLFAATFDANYVMQFFDDGTSLVEFSETGDPVGEGFWNESRIVYSNDTCSFF